MAEITRRPARVPWSLTRGDTATVTLTFVDETAIVLDLTGRTFVAEVLDKAGGTWLGAITVDASAAASGVLVLTIDGVLSSTLTGFPVWFLQETVASQPRTLLDGPVSVAAQGGSGIGAVGANALTVQIIDTQIQITTTSVTGPALGGGGSMTAAAILTAIKTVDGVGSGLDADTLDGLSSAAFDAAGAAAAAQAASQPLDSDLTAIALLSTTSYGRAFLVLANQAALMALVSSSTDTTQGIVELATTGEATTGSDTVRAVTPAGLKAAIDAAVAGLIAAAPGALDTLNELAAALGNDANFAGTITAALAGKQPVDADLTAIAALTTTSFGRSFLALVDAAAGRTLLGLGTAAVVNTTAFDSAGAAAVAQAAAVQRANHTGNQLASTISNFATTVAATAALKANNLSDVASAVTARTNLGVRPGAAAEVSEDFSNKGTAALGVADTTQTPTKYQTASTNSALTITSGKLTNSATAAAAVAGYAEYQLAGNVTRMGGHFSFTAGASTQHGSVVFAVWKTTGVNLISLGVPDSPCHVVITPLGWELDVFTGAALTTVAFGGFSPTLATDGTLYSAEVEIVGTTAYLRLPDGSVQKITNATIGTNAGAFATFEVYQQLASTDNRASFHDYWADSNGFRPGIPGAKEFYDNYSSRLYPVVNHYAPGYSDVSIPTSEADVDGTNLTISAKIPPSGKVKIEFECYVSMTNDDQILWALRRNGVSIQYCTVTTLTTNGRVHATFLDTGQTVGDTIVYTWRHFRTGGAGTALVKLNSGSGYAATMTATPIA